jgi:DNA-binding GntR family transcriptional regulator
LGVTDDHGDPRIYLRIAGALRERIRAGEFAGDGKIPSVRTVAQEYEVAYDTAQHAVRTLEAEGLVRRYPGRGYYVTRG